MKQPFLRSFKRYGWFILPLLVIAAGTVFSLTRHEQPESMTALSPAPMTSPLSSPTPTSSSTAAKSARSLPHPSPSARASSPSPRPSRTPHDPEALTPEQAALNQRNKADFQASLPTVDSLIDMRVAIAEGLPVATIRTSQEAAVLNSNGEPVRKLAAETTYTVRPGDQSIRLNSSRLPSAVLIDPSPQGIFYLGFGEGPGVETRSYRGQLLLLSDNGGLWAVNAVSMRSYLYSVVGSEVSPSWNMEALKAQAVAARSYALTYYFRPVNSVYHLGSTERYQVYRGIEREAPRTREAVDGTAGEFVSHRGDIVESLYAASDDIVMEAFQGHGMSQLGALDLANQGYTYKQILKNYYPDTGVGRIEQELE
ncbi:MAG TPA: SpoIID/LytB domain-containing protein [Crinalium sp.]